MYLLHVFFIIHLSFSLSIYLSICTLQGRDSSDDSSTPFSITVTFTLTIENKTKTLERKCTPTSSYTFTPEEHWGFFDYVPLADITEHSGFLFDGKIRICLELYVCSFLFFFSSYLSCILIPSAPRLMEIERGTTSVSSFHHPRDGYILPPYIATIIIVSIVNYFPFLSYFFRYNN